MYTSSSNHNRRGSLATSKILVGAISKTTELYSVRSKATESKSTKSILDF